MSESVYVLAISYLLLIVASFVAVTVLALLSKRNIALWRGTAILMWGGFFLAYFSKEMSWHLLRNAGAFAIQIGVLIVLYRMLLAAYRWGRGLHKR